MWHTVPLDNSDQADKFPNYSNILTHGEFENPLNRILAEDDEPLKEIDPYSLEYAWHILMNKYHRNMNEVATYLKISAACSRHLYKMALLFSIFQLPLPLFFFEEPGPWRRYFFSLTQEQLMLSFEKELMPRQFSFQWEICSTRKKR